MTAETFLKELERIIKSHPKWPLNQLDCEDCDNCDYVYNSKNLYACFDASNSVDSMYLFDTHMCVNTADCDYTVESELCYECADAYKAYNCNYLDNCSYVRDSSYCYACSNCNNLFGCSNLNSKSFCIFNRQLNEEDYNQELKKYKNLPPEKVLSMLEDLKKEYPVTQTNEGHNENTVYGNYIYENKNCYLCFDAARNENGMYLYDSFSNKTCMDTAYGVFSELSYQVVDTGWMFNVNFCVCCNKCQDGSYLFNCFDVTNSLGCVGLKHKKYCILNRQLNKNEYKKISGQILTDLKNKNLGWSDLIF